MDSNAISLSLASGRAMIRSISFIIRTAPSIRTLNRFCCLWIDQTEFGLQTIESLPGLIGAVDDLIPVHPFGFIVEDVFPAGSHQGLTMFLHRSIEKTISIFFRCFEDRTPRIQERGEGRDEGEEFVVGTKSFQERTTIIDGLQDGWIGLFWKAGHEEEIDPLGAEIDGIADHPFQAIHCYKAFQRPFELLHREIPERFRY